jgi:16S rRNA (uracil1498-N3)-methyltransferase
MHIFVEDLSAESVIVSGEDAHHLLVVRRIQKGEVFPLVEETGPSWGLGRVSRLAKHQVELVVEVRYVKPKPPLPRLILYPAILKRAAMERVLQCAVELGVDTFHPIQASRSIPSSDAVNLKRWGTIVREAAMQSHRYAIPKVNLGTSFYELETSSTEPLIVLTTQPTRQDLKTWVDSQPKPPLSLGVLIGPEGGWTVSEEALLVDKGVALVSFGTSIMRADTASLGVLSALRYAYHTVS